MKKYTLSETETREWLGHTLRRVIYTDEWLDECELDGEGACGGWIENEKNLSQDTCATVYGNAMVYGNARVYGDARVSQGITTSMNIKTTAQWHEYQYRQAELQRKWDIADGKVER